MCIVIYEIEVFHKEKKWQGKEKFYDEMKAAQEKEIEEYGSVVSY